MNVRRLVFSITILAVIIALSVPTCYAAEQPNFVVIFIDDMGYGDIGPFGSKANDTPHLDQMAEEGLKLTSFYAAPVCSASRAQILTGCYAPRVSVPGVFFPAGPRGLNSKEITVAEYLRESGYATACIGKWHLGDQPEFLPTNQGFDQYFGIPYSNDMQRVSLEDGRRVVPLLRNDKVAELLDDEAQRRVTREYTEEAVRFIESQDEKPFFLYLPHTAMHVPLFPHVEFVGKSRNGTYGDWVAEVDWSVGKVLDAVRRRGIEKETLVIFTTDNGPWASKGRAGGVSGPLRGSKGCTLEGGVRVPTIAWWPGRIDGGTESAQIAGTTDILPTLVALAGASPQKDVKIDGRDITPLLLGEDHNLGERAWFYYQGTNLQAVRSGPWKLAIAPQSLGMGIREKAADLQSKEPRLYNLVKEIGEKTNVAADNPEVVSRLTELIATMAADIGSGQPGPGVRLAGAVDKPVTLYPTAKRGVRPQKSAKPVDWKKVKTGEAFASAAVGDLSGRDFSVRFVVDRPPKDAILVAHGGTALGYVVYAKNGELVFAVRLSSDRISRVTMPIGDVEELEVVANATKRGLNLEVNGKSAGSDFAGRLPGQPQEDFCLGHDNGNPVDPTAPRAAYAGEIREVELSLK